MRTRLAQAMPAVVLCIVVLLAGSRAGGGDGGTSPPTGAATQPADRDLTVRPLDADAVAAIKDLMPLRNRDGAFVLRVDDKRERTIPFHIEPIDDGQWRFTLDGVRLGFFKADEEGGILVPREDDLGERVQITYDPPLRMLPGRWPAERVIEGSCKMLVKSLKTGGVREKGTCEYRVELVGRQRVMTPAGEFDAVLVRDTRRIRLRMAKADVTCLTWYVPGVGDVAEHVDQKTKAVLVINDTSTEDMRLAR